MLQIDAIHRMMPGRGRVIDSNDAEATQRISALLDRAGVPHDTYSGYNTWQIRDHDGFWTAKRFTWDMCWAGDIDHILTMLSDHYKA